MLGDGENSNSKLSPKLRHQEHDYHLNLYCSQMSSALMKTDYWNTGENEVHDRYQECNLHYKQFRND